MNQLEEIEKYFKLINKIKQKIDNNNEEIALIKTDLKKSKRDLIGSFIINLIWYFRGISFFIKPNYLMIEIILVSLVSFILTSILLLFYDIMKTNKKIIKAKENEQVFLLKEIEELEEILEKLKNNSQDVILLKDRSMELRYIYYECDYSIDKLNDKYLDKYILEKEKKGKIKKRILRK